MESHEMYRQFFENSKDAVFIVAPDGRLLDINPAGLEMFGYASKEEKPDFNVVPDVYADPSTRDLLLRKLSESGYVKDYRVEVKRKDGKRLIVLASVSLVRDENGKVVAHQGILHEITERARTLFTSGYTEDIIVHHGGVDENLNFIGKPYSLQALAGKIREVVERESPVRR